jgi:hypothetical protein
MSIEKHFDKDNLHHAYLVEGMREEVLPQILKFLNILDIAVSGNPDCINISIDNFKIDEALSLRAMSTDKSFSSAKRIFIICANTFSLDAQNVLLKMFEEPTTDTHFFLITPDTHMLIKTLVSRFYFISTKSNLSEEIKTAERFLGMSPRNRIDFIKELLTEVEEEDSEGNEIIPLDSVRSNALKFLNALEATIHGKFVDNLPRSSTNNSLQICLSHFFKVREFLRMPGSSAKSLMESVALITPNF